MINSILINISASVIPVVSILADNDSVCSGVPVNFIATPANGGIAPTYQWKVNGLNSATGVSFSPILNDGDSVSCIMTSNSNCAIVPTATSNAVAISVNSLPNVTISPTGNLSVCANDSIKLTAGGGISFSWIKQ